jgi:hypothetical protein
MREKWTLGEINSGFLFILMTTSTWWWSIIWFVSIGRKKQTNKRDEIEISIRYSYVISEPPLFPKCSPVSIPNVPAP